MTLTRDESCCPLTSGFCSMLALTHTGLPLKASDPRLGSERHSMSARHAARVGTSHDVSVFEIKHQFSARLTQLDLTSNMRGVHHVQSRFSTAF